MSTGRKKSKKAPQKIIALDTGTTKAVMQCPFCQCEVVVYVKSETVFSRVGRSGGEGHVRK